MPISIPIPEGLQIPQEPQFELPVLFELKDDALYALAVDGIAISEEGEEPEAEEAEGEAPEKEMNFMNAVEQGMKK